MIDVKKYLTKKDMKKGVKKMKRKRWSVKDVETKEERIGCSFFAFLLPKKTVYVVTFEKYDGGPA